jgi:hypothetical protein
MTDKLDYIEFPSTNRVDALSDTGLDGGVDQAPEKVAATMAIVRTDNLDDAERRVLAAGGTITKPQFDYPGGRRFHFREPGGNEMAVYIARE